jgi:DNA-binding MarR family transcriptional regulator
MTEDRSPSPGIAFLLSQLGGHASRAWTNRLARIGLEPREVMLFRFVARAEGRSQRDVASAIGLPASRIVGLVDRLEAQGWIERRASATDRRTHALHVTAAGRTVLERVRAVSREHEAELTAGLDPAERTVLMGLLDRIARGQGLLEGVHPAFADPAADPGRVGLHAETDDTTSAADQGTHDGGPDRASVGADDGPSTATGKPG